MEQAAKIQLSEAAEARMLAIGFGMPQMAGDLRRLAMGLVTSSKLLAEYLEYGGDRFTTDPSVDRVRGWSEYVDALTEWVRA